MRIPRPYSGFTTLEFTLILVVIGILGALMFTARSGMQQNDRNAERQRDIKELRNGLEGFFAANNQYPSLQALNDTTWRSVHLTSIGADVYRDPKGGKDNLVEKPTPGAYTYSVSSANGTPCGSAGIPCTRYTLTATIEGGGLFAKSNLN